MVAGKRGSQTTIQKRGLTSQPPRTGYTINSALTYFYHNMIALIYQNSLVPTEEKKRRRRCVVTHRVGQEMLPIVIYCCTYLSILIGCSLTHTICKPVSEWLTGASIFLTNPSFNFSNRVYQGCPNILVLEHIQFLVAMDG